MSKKGTPIKKVKEEVPAPVEGSLDLKESLEMVKGIDTLLEGLEDALEDGKIDWKDSVTGLKLLNKFSVFSEAAKNANLIPDELKDLDEQEIVTFAKALYPLLKRIKAIVLSLKKA